MRHYLRGFERVRIRRMMTVCISCSPVRRALHHITTCCAGLAARLTTEANAAAARLRDGGDAAVVAGERRRGRPPGSTALGQSSVAMRRSGMSACFHARVCDFHSYVSAVQFFDEYPVAAAQSFLSQFVVLLNSPACTQADAVRCVTSFSATLESAGAWASPWPQLCVYFARAIACQRDRRGVQMWAILMCFISSATCVIARAVTVVRWMNLSVG